MDYVITSRTKTEETKHGKFLYWGFNDDGWILSKLLLPGGVEINLFEPRAQDYFKAFRHAGVVFSIGRNDDCQDGFFGGLLINGLHKSQEERREIMARLKEYGFKSTFEIEAHAHLATQWMSR